MKRINTKLSIYGSGLETFPKIAKTVMPFNPDTVGSLKCTVSMAQYVWPGNPSLSPLDRMPTLIMATKAFVSVVAVGYKV